MKEETGILRFLPYLLQDLWALGSNPEDVIRLIDRHMVISEKTKILDLACGKGAVAIKIAQSLNVKVFGIDLIPEFIEYAGQKAEELNVGTLCHFASGDINEAVLTEKGYDCVILGSAGNALGTLTEVTIWKTVLPALHGCSRSYEQNAPRWASLINPPQ